MSKIIGVTVGTPIRPEKILDKAKAVKTVNGVEPDENGNVQVDVPDVDLTGYATKEYVDEKIAEVETGDIDLSDYALRSDVPTKVSQLQNDKGYLTEHQDVSGKLDASALPTAINTALAQAKASGEFDGKDGVDGKDGKDGYTPQKNVDYFDGKDGSNGADGISATHSWNGTTLTITSASGTSSANLKGDKGDKGESIKGDPGADGYTPVKNKDYFDGKDGKDGNPGADGVSPTVAVSKSGKVTTVSITDKNGTKTATINDGVDGSNGSNGKDGTSVTVKSVSESTADGGSNVVTFSDGKTVTIKNGSKGSAGSNGSNGADGVSVSSVKQTTTSTADGGSNVVTVTLSNGTTSTFTVKNGSKGDKGDPGGDYVMTEADMDKIVAEVQASANQQHPLFANKVADCTDTTKVYVLPDGYLYGYFYKEGTPPAITYETKTDGYWSWDATNNRFLTVTSSGWKAKLSNKIPVTPGDQLSYKGKMQYSGNKSYVWFDANGKAVDSGTINSESSPTVLTAPTGAASVQFASFSQTTVVLEVEWVLCQAAAPTYQWASTGHAFVPADYEDRILTLESSVSGSGGSLKGKTIVYDGDSICESRTGSAANNGGGFAKLIADKTGSTYVNQAVGGARLTTAVNGATYHSVVDNLPNLPKNADLYCFEGGINDYWTPKALGTFSKTDFTGTLDTNTICGALETIFRYALTNFVGKPICFVIAHKIQNTAYVKNTNGDTFEDYRNAMVGICNKYSIPYYDAFSESGLNGWNTAQNNAYLTSNTNGTADGIHPNAEGYKRYYVPQLISLFEKIMPVQ